jgi:hypothetical protein
MVVDVENLLGPFSVPPYKLLQPTYGLRPFVYAHFSTILESNFWSHKAEAPTAERKNAQHL